MAVYLGNNEFDTIKGKINLEELEEILEDIKNFTEVQELIERIFKIYTENDLNKKFEEGYEKGYSESKEEAISLIESM